MKFPRRFLSICSLFLLLAAAGPTLWAQDRPAQNAWPIRFVVIATFPGEYELWGEREKLTEAVDVPGVALPVHTNADTAVTVRNEADLGDKMAHGEGAAPVGPSFLG